MKAAEFGRYLRKLRQDKELTIRQVEIKSGVSNSYLSQLENGKRGIPSPEILKQLAPALGVSYIELMIAAGYMPRDFVRKERYRFHETEAEYDAEGRRGSSKTEIDLKAFGKWIAELRAEKGFRTQKDLAKAIGVSDSTISRLERGKQLPELDTLKKLAPALGLEYGELLEAIGYVDPEEAPEVLDMTAKNDNPDIRAISRAAEKLNPEQIEMLKRMAQALFPDAFEE